MATPFRQLIAKALNKEIDFDSDNLVLTLHTSAYTPNLDTHDYVDDITAELAAGGGYATGGWPLTSKTVTVTAANSWATTRANSTTYAAGDVVRPAAGNGFLYQAVTAGTTGASLPTYPTAVGATVVDGTVTWVNVGSGIFVFDAADITQANFTAGPFRYAVISDRTPGTAATQPLIGLIDFGSDRTGGGGTGTIAFASQGILQFFLP